MKNSFNTSVGLSGFAGISNLFGTTSTILAQMAASQTGTTGGSTSISTLTNKLSTLQSERTSLSQKIVAAEAEIARLLAARGDCKRTFGWDNGCLDNNTRASQQHQTLISSYKARIAAIDLEIPKIQSEISIAQKSQQDAAAAAAKLEQDRLASQAAAAQAQAAADAQRLAAESAKITAQANANPENLQIQAQAQIALAQAQAAAQTATQAATLEAASEKSKTLIYVGAGITALVIVVVAVMFIFKK